jgi:hypothetical protein
MLKRRDESSGKWCYFADDETRKKWREIPAYRKSHAQQINVLQMKRGGWAYETYSFPPGFGKIARRKESAKGRA